MGVMAATLQEMVRAAGQVVAQLPPAEVKERLDRGEIAAVVDVREPAEFAEAHVVGALLVPRGVLELQADPSTPIANATLCDNRDATIVLYCTRGPSARSLLAAQTLAHMGYTDAVALEGGLTAWEEQGLPVDR